MAAAVKTIQPPSLGLNTEAAPARVRDGQAPELVNLLPGFPGRAPVRGPLLAKREHAPSSVSISAIWPVDEASGRFYFARNDVGDNKFYAGRADGGSIVAHAVSGAELKPGRGGSVVRRAPDAFYVYGYAAGVAGPEGRHLLCFKTDLVSLSTPVISVSDYSFAPFAADAVTYWRNRLFTIGGHDPNTASTLDPAALRWSDPFTGLLPDNLNAWKDDVSGLLNKILVDGLDQPATALAVVNDSLAILAPTGVWTLRGSGPSNWQVRQELYGRGCIDAASIVPYDDGIFFLAHDGYFFWDGAQLINFSESVLSAVSDNFDRASACRLSNDYLLLTVGRYGLGGGPTPAEWQGILHVPTRSWTVFESSALNSGAFDSVANVGRTPVGLDGRNVWNLSSVVKPQAATENGHSITARVRSRLNRMPSLKGVVQRLVADYRGRDWRFRLLDSVGVTQYDIQDQGDGRRYIAEPYLEIDEVQVEAEYTGDGGDTPELGEMYLEFDHAQRGGSF